MAKKGKKGGKKGGKKTEPQETELLSAAERELFQIQISDLLQTVEKMKTRCIDLEMGNEEFQKKYEQLDEDRADIIAYLKKIVQEREDEITGLKQLIDGLQKAVQEEIRNNKEVVESHEHEFKMMYEQLTSEIKLLTGKLNSLEEFRTQRDDIMKKFKVQEAEMDEQEERHRTVQYEVEKKSIIGKDRLKKDIEARLAQLCADFQDAAHIRIAATTHQAIRENIAVNNELEKMLGALRAVTKKNDFLKERDRKMELEFQLRKEEKDIVTSKSMAQLKLINRLSSEHEEMVRHLGELQNSAQRGKDLEQLVVETRAHLDRAVQHIAQLEDRVRTTERDKDETNTMLVKSDVEIYNLQKVLSAAVVSVKNAIEIQKSPNADEAFNLSRRENLIANLLQLLNTADLTEFESRGERLETKAELSAMYLIGHLGLVPRSSIELREESHYTVGSNIAFYSGSSASNGKRGQSELSREKAEDLEIPSKSASKEEFKFIKEPLCEIDDVTSGDLEDVLLESTAVEQEDTETQQIEEEISVWQPEDEIPAPQPENQIEQQREDETSTPQPENQVEEQTDEELPVAQPEDGTSASPAES